MYGNIVLICLFIRKPGTKHDNISKNQFGIAVDITQQEL